MRYRTRQIFSGIARPITVAGTSYSSKMRRTFSTLSGRTASIIRSWLSDTQISHGARPSSFSGTLSRSTSAPNPPARAISPTTHERPPPPRSFIPSRRPARADSMHAWISGSFRIGSPSWTAPASHSRTDRSVRSTLAYVTPWIPSRPVLPPHRMKTSRTEEARLRTSCDFFAKPTHATFTTMLPRYPSSNTMPPATVGMPTRFP